MRKITIFTNGTSLGNPGPAAIGTQIVDAKGTIVREVSEAIGNAGNNFAEYHAVLRGLETAKDIYGKSTKELAVEVKIESELVKKQLNGEYPIKEPGLVPYFIAIHNLRIMSFPRLTITHVRREHNQEANRLLQRVLGAD